MSTANKPESVAEIIARRKASEQGTTKQPGDSPERRTAPKKAVKPVGKKQITSNKLKKPRRGREIVSDMASVKKVDVYLAFIEFLATPPHLKDIQTQEEFSKKYEVSGWTLSEWKKRDGFFDDVDSKRKEIINEKMLTFSLTALHKKIVTEGNGSDVKVLWQIAGKFEERKVVETKKNVKKLSVERKEQILKNIQNWKVK